MSSVSWRKRLSELSCVSSRHHHYGERRIDSRIHQVKAQDQDKQLDEIIWLKLAIYCVHGYVKICLKRVSPIVEYGEQSARLHRASSIKKGGPTWEDQDRIHLAQVECARQRYILDRVSFLPVS
jgi:hypothetical protein